MKLLWVLLFFFGTGELVSRAAQFAYRKQINRKLYCARSLRPPGCFNETGAIGHLRTRRAQLRVAVLGGSNAMGVFLTRNFHHNSYPGQLQQLSHHRIHVDNYSVFTVSPRRLEHTLLEIKQQQRDYDLILLEAPGPMQLYALNVDQPGTGDREMDVFTYSRNWETMGAWVFPELLRNQVRLWTEDQREYPQGALYPGLLPSHFRRELKDYLLKPRLVRRSLPEQDWREGGPALDKLRSEFSSILRLAKGLAPHVVVLGFPTITPSRPQAEYTKFIEPIQRANDMARALADEQGLFFLDVHQLLGGSPGHFLDLHHFNRTGHQIVAKAVSTYIRDQKLLTHE